MRIGWITANPDFTGHMIEAKNNISICNDGLSQYAAAELFRRGDVERQIPKVTKVYRKKRDVMLEAMETSWPKKAKWEEPKGGLFLWVKMPKNFNTDELLQGRGGEGRRLRTGEPILLKARPQLHAPQLQPPLRGGHSDGHTDAGQAPQGEAQVASLMRCRPWSTPSSSTGPASAATASTSEEIAKVLREEGLEVRVVDAKKEKVKDIAGYDLVIVGSGIAMGKWTSEPEDFLKRFRGELAGKKVALFVSCGSASPSPTPKPEAGRAARKNVPRRQGGAVRAEPRRPGLLRRPPTTTTTCPGGRACS